MTANDAAVDQASARQPTSSGIDLERLAEQVYRLMQAELRLGLARGEAAPRRSGSTRLGG